MRAEAGNADEPRALDPYELAGRLAFFLAVSTPDDELLALEVDGAPRFGEFCLYPGSGLDRFAADWIDFELGSLWHSAAQIRASNSSVSKGFETWSSAPPRAKDSV